MALTYSTGTANTLQDLVDQIRGVALSQGYTIDKYDTTNKLLFLHNAATQVYLAFLWDGTPSVTHFPTVGGGSVSMPTWSIRGNMCTGITAASTTIWQHPGSLVTTSSYSNHYTEFLMPAGPCTYHFFYDTNFIYLVTVVGEVHRHLNFGLLDQGDYTHAGVGFHSCSMGAFYARTASSDLNNSSYTQNDPGFHSPGFGYYPMDTSAVGQVARETTRFHCPDCLPALNFGTNKISGDFNLGSTNSYYHTGVQVHCPNQPNGRATQSGLNAEAPILLWSNFAQPQAWAAQAPMVTVPALIVNSARNALVIPGWFPNMRIMRIDGLTPGQELTLGAETWKVFPVTRQANFISNTANKTRDVTSGQYGIAYRKA